MKALYKIAIVTAGLYLGFINENYGQSLPVGSPFEDYYRRAQLLDQIDSNTSFTLRPLFTNYGLRTNDVFNPDTDRNDKWTKPTKTWFANRQGVLQVLPFHWQNQLNTDHPYGWNDGAMIPAKGYQTLITGGVYLKYGPLSITFQPEYVYAVNLPFAGFASGHNDQDLANYLGLHSLIDYPERFGTSAYSKATWGQSSIRLTFGPVSIGLSNENLWWGPGIQNALVLSDNSPGFLHLTINSIRPVKTPVGYFEWQVIGGHLDNSGYPPLLQTTNSAGTNLYQMPINDWRYLSGFNINYHPNWLKGVTIGLIRTFDAYEKDVRANGFSALVPFFTPYQKNAVNGGIGDAFPRDQITSIYARWLLPKAQAEMYFEYGFEDNLYNLDDLLQSPEHSRAYIFGFRKFLPWATKKDQHLLLSAEITQTSQHTESAIREDALWYYNYQLLQGHTNNGQILGAGSGPGGNLQYFDLSWVSGLKRLGIDFERLEHDVDFAQLYFPDINGNSRNWVDFAVSLHGEWNYKNLIFNAKLQTIKSLNYEWILANYNPNNPYYIPNNTVYNLHAELGVTYRF
jgi:hypothetical protein